MKTISIVTIQNSSNYGAMLQAYALQEYISNLGLDVEIINYDNRYMSKGLDHIRHGFSKVDIYYSIIDIMNIKRRYKMISNFKDFSKKYLKLGDLVSREKLLTGKYPNRDIYISGSDQIWNPNVTNDRVDAVYFCGMCSSEAKVISYASSMGGYNFQNIMFNKEIAHYLEKYSSITTREDSYIPKLEELTNKKIKKVLDPVFLLTEFEWKKITDSKRPNGTPYILIYVMAAHERIIEKVRKSYLNTDYKIKAIYEPLIRKKGIEYIVDAGPREFVELFSNAEIIITNSFHGMAMGLIFKKRLKVVDNARNMNRIYDLLNALDCTAILAKDNEPLYCDFKIDYEIVNRKLKRLINDSKSYLLKELL